MELDDELARELEERFDDDVANRCYDLRVQNEARRLQALESWEEPEDEGDLAHQIANPEPDIGHLVEGLIRARGIVQINAQYKVGKTTLASVNLPKALVTGEPFLGRFSVHFGSDECVGIWNLEVDRQDIVDWLAQIDIPDPDCKRIFPKCLRGNRAMDFRNELAMEWTVNWLKDRNITVWIIDPLSKLYRGEENSSTEYNEWWLVLEDIMRRAGVRVTVLVHHSGHSGEGRARGTSAMMGNPDVLIEYRHGGAHGEAPPDTKRWLKAFGRRVDQPEIQLDWNPGTGALVVDPHGGSRALAEVERMAKRFYAAVIDADKRGLHPNKSTLFKTLGWSSSGNGASKPNSARQYALDKHWVVVGEKGQGGIPHSPGPASPKDGNVIQLGTHENANSNKDSE
ncbi:AAA family ATPase [Mycobacterium sp. DL592]|uniref:AAA family ATPase n=1 Tax=Mycobacterium sp. DL592 TaxID=2675524 RepID=UPI00141FE69D|nr:AAA family ATPase [Mycobacterium sp. DL592]